LIWLKHIFLSALFLAFCTGGSIKINAQGHQIGLYITTISPSGQFNENVTNNGWAVSGFFLKRIGPSPFLIGAEGGVGDYGSESRREPLSTTLPNLPSVKLNVSTVNLITLAHFLTRVQPRKRRFLPYADGLFGMKNLSTTTAISAISSSGETIASTSTTHVSDYTFFNERAGNRPGKALL
jgi:hypothetical protein